MHERSEKRTNEERNETTPVSFIAYSARKDTLAGGFCLRVSAMEARKTRKARDGTRGREGEQVVRTSSQSESLPTDFRISSRGGLLVLSLMDLRRILESRQAGGRLDATRRDAGMPERPIRAGCWLRLKGLTNRDVELFRSRPGRCVLPVEQGNGRIRGKRTWLYDLFSLSARPRGRGTRIPCVSWSVHFVGRPEYTGP